jgi:hypothetical protein
MCPFFEMLGRGKSNKCAENSFGGNEKCVAMLSTVKFQLMQTIKPPAYWILEAMCQPFIYVDTWSTLESR